jgi:prefoldin subunit 5
VSNPRDRALADLREAAAEIKTSAVNMQESLNALVQQAEDFELKADALDVEYSIEEPERDPPLEPDEFDDLDLDEEPA